MRDEQSAVVGKKLAKWPSPKNETPRKVQKSTDFFTKSVLLVVAGEGFEPTTSGL